MIYKKILKPIYYKYFAKIKYFTVHLRGRLSPEKKIFFNNHPFRIELKNLNKAINLKQENILEIGFGDGYHLLRLAIKNPNTNFIGVELDEISIYKILKKIDVQNIKNLYIVCADARTFVDKIKSNTFQKVFIPFPDPWPKRREHKKRLLNKEFIENILTKIPDTGELVIATDIDSYKDQVESILLEIQSQKQINFEKCDEQDNSGDNTIFNSKFAMKAKKEGRTNSLFAITKTIS